MMNARIYSDSVAKPLIKKVAITEQEIEKKLQHIHGEEFTNLIKQLVAKRTQLATWIRKGQNFQSTSNYYSTTILKNKFYERLSNTLTHPTLSDPLSFTQQVHMNEFDNILEDVNKALLALKAQIKTNMELTRPIAAVIDKIQEPLFERLLKKKCELIQALQKAAQEYRQYLLSKGEKEWRSKFPQFMDIFGCVVIILSSQPPYELDTTKGYGLQFGHDIRVAGKLPRIHTTIEVLQEYHLAALEKMINTMIAESVKHKDYNALYYLRNTLDKLATENRDFFKIEEEGRIFLYIKNFSVLAKDEDLTQTPLNQQKKYLKDMEDSLDGELLQKANDFLKKLQQRANSATTAASASIRLIKRESAITAEYLQALAEKRYKEINLLCDSMKSINAETKKNCINTLLIAQKVQQHYNDAIQQAKLGKKAEAERLQEAIVTDCKDTQIALDVLMTNFTKLETYQQNIAKRLDKTKQQFAGSMQPLCAMTFAKESKEFEKIKSIKATVVKEYEEVRALPLVLKTYGEIVLYCAHVQTIIAELNQLSKEINQRIRLLWDLYHETLRAAEVRDEVKMHELKDAAMAAFVRAEEGLKKRLEKLAYAKKIKDDAEFKLEETKSSFSAEIHSEYQEIFAATHLLYINVEKDSDAVTNAVCVARELPRALTEYAGIKLYSAMMQNEMAEMKEACAKVNDAVLEVRKAGAEAVWLAQMGVTKLSLKIRAINKLEQAKSILMLTTTKLRKAAEFKCAAEEKLAAAKKIFLCEIHAKEEESFHIASIAYEKAAATHVAAIAAIESVKEFPSQIEAQLVDAKKIAKEKQLAAGLKQLILETILNNLELWKISKWGGGVNFYYAGKNHRIPHGIAQMLSELYATTHHKAWMAKIVQTAIDRDQLARTNWKYTFFGVRDDPSTGCLYRAIQAHLKLTDGSFEVLQAAVMKIPGLRLGLNRSKSM